VKCCCVVFGIACGTVRESACFCVVQRLTNDATQKAKKGEKLECVIHLGSKSTFPKIKPHDFNTVCSCTKSASVTNTVNGYSPFEGEQTVEKHSKTHTHTHTHTHSLSHTHTHTHSLSHTHTQSVTHTHSLSHTHTHSLSHTHTAAQTIMCLLTFALK